MLLDTLETIAENLHVKSIRGNRYKAPIREFYEVILILGGPRLASFVSCNLNGPSIDSIYNWRSREIPSLDCMPTDENMKKLAQIYVKLMEKHGIAKIPVLTAEDETAIKKVVSYDNKEDKLVSFCGMKTGNDGKHQCLKEISIVLGNDEHTYDLMIDSFKYEIAGSARVVLLNPLHPALPQLVLLLAPTCNRFTSEDVKAQ